MTTSLTHPPGVWLFSASIVAALLAASVLLAVLVDLARATIADRRHNHRGAQPLSPSSDRCPSAASPGVDLPPAWAVGARLEVEVWTVNTSSSPAQTALDEHAMTWVVSTSRRPDVVRVAVTVRRPDGSLQWTVVGGAAIDPAVCRG